MHIISTETPSALACGVQSLTFADAPARSKFTPETLASSPISLKTASKNIIGKIGEDLPRSEFTDIQNLNDIKHNFPIFDIIGKKDDEIYVFSVKARKKYGENLKLNPNYNILSGKDGAISRKYKKALDNLTEMGYDTTLIHYCFLHLFSFQTPIFISFKCFYKII